MINGELEHLAARDVGGCSGESDVRRRRLDAFVMVVLELRPGERADCIRHSLRPGDYVEDNADFVADVGYLRSEEHTSELQSLMRISYDVFCLKKTPKRA